jgi:hypothetical protein
VRHYPRSIDRVAMEAAAELVEDAAPAHRIERGAGHSAGSLVALSLEAKK